MPGFPAAGVCVGARGGTRRSSYDRRAAGRRMRPLRVARSRLAGLTVLRVQRAAVTGRQELPANPAEGRGDAHGPKPGTSSPECGCGPPASSVAPRFGCPYSVSSEARLPGGWSLRTNLRRNATIVTGRAYRATWRRASSFAGITGRWAGSRQPRAGSST
jgi:hypothetical protein